ncbi:MAG: hypothetical protein U0176_02395 [Bacteroidia bacterium]
MKDKKALVFLGAGLLIVWVGYQLVQYYRSGAGDGVQARFSTYSELRNQELADAERGEVDGFYGKLEAAYHAVLGDSGSTAAANGGKNSGAGSGIATAVTVEYLRFVFEESKGMAQSEVDDAYGKRFGSSSLRPPRP